MLCASEKWVPALFSAWNKAGVEYVVLRNYENLPGEIGNDLDVLVDPSRIRDAEIILIEVIVQHGGLLHNRAEFSPISLFFHDGETRQQFHVDLFRGLTWRGAEILSAKQVLANYREHNGYRVVSEEHEAILNLLTRLLYGGYVKDSYKEKLEAYLSDNRQGMQNALSKIVGKPCAKMLVDNISDQNWDDINSVSRDIRLALLKTGILKQPFTVIGVLLGDSLRLFVRWVINPGISLVLMGPDGCGKTSVGVELKNRLAGTFYERYVQYMHWKPRLMKGKAEAANPFGIPCTDPHGKPPRNPIMNALYFLAHSLEIPPAWLLRVKPRLFRNMLVMIDRYYYDFMVDSRRYRMLVSERWAWFMYRFMPKPDLVFCLIAPTEVIQSRKSEVAPEETERQCRAYEKVAERLPYGHVIDTNRSLEQVVDEVEAVILRHLVSRNARRMHGR